MSLPKHSGVPAPFAASASLSRLALPLAFALGRVERLPRRRGPDSWEMIKRGWSARWRYLLRNPAFRAEFQEVLRLHHRDERGMATLKLRQFLPKWELARLPQEVLRPRMHPRFGHLASFPEVSVENLQFYEQLFGDFDESTPFVHPAHPQHIPEDDDESSNRFEEGFLTLTVNVKYPLDVLLWLVEREIRQQREDRQEFESQYRRLKQRPRPYKRPRPEKADLYLAVFDRAEQGETFAAIAKAIRQRPSTVKSAFLAASRNIYGLEAAPSKKALPLSDFDANTHTPKCPTCKVANTFDAMCLRAKRFALQDPKGGRELTRFDTVRDTSPQKEP